MPSVPLPVFDKLVSGEDYNRPQAPTSDAADPVNIGSGQIPNVPGGMASPLTQVSTATQSGELPGNEQTWASGDKGTNWMGGSTLPWQK